MSDTTQKRALGEESCHQMAALVLLDRLVAEPEKYHAGMMDEDDNLMEPLFDFMMREDLISVGEDDHFSPTEKGRKAYQTLLDQQQSYLANFDVYAAVDLAEGRFGDAERDNLDAPNWTDLRVAAAEYKGIDPYRMVFLSMLADGTFFENPGWKFDILLGSSFFKELEGIVGSQIGVEELGYQDEDGTPVSGETVLEDVILQGAEVNRERMERERESESQASLFDEEENRRGRDDDDWEEEWVYVPYDPWMPATAYMGSALFVEALWLSSYW